ncbi:hypothetical protein ACWDV7_03515 [Streptomyces sp. NPDC003362]
MPAQQRIVPFADGMALGLGLDDLTGAVGTLRAITFETATAATSDEGMEARYDTALLYSSQQMYESLGVSVSAEGRYGMFSAEGKFSFAEQSRFNSQSTFLLARADIQNAFVSVDRPAPVEDAHELVSRGDTETFRKRYGDLFIRGMKSGGEFIAILSITSESQENQRKLGVALKASFDGLMASGSVSTEIQHEIAELRQRSEVRVTTYQRGGSGDGISYTGTIEAVMERLKSFANSVKQHPKAYSVQAAPYDTLVFRDRPNWFDIRRAQEVLEDCLKKRLHLLTLRNDIELVLLHPEYFKAPPTAARLNDWSRQVTGTINALDRHITGVVDQLSADAEFFTLTLPEDLVLPERLLHSSRSVEIYTHADYQMEPWQGIPGRKQVLGPGWYDDAQNQILVGNDQISSLKVPEGLAVRAYEHAWFQGQFIGFTTDVPAVPMDWNDRISSLVVFAVADGPPKVDHVVALDFAWGPRRLVLKEGRYPDLAATALGAHTLGALLIPRDFIVRLWDGPDFTGNSVEFHQDTTALPPEWDNRAASLEVIAIHG